MQTSRGFLGQQFNRITRRNSYPLSYSAKLEPTTSLSPKNKNPQTVENNPKHPELNKKVCSNPDYKNKVCPTHCSDIIENKSVGHATKGNPNVNHGDVYLINANKKLGRDEKPQNAVLYHVIQDTTNNQKEMEPHTSNLKNDTNALQVLKNN